MEAAWGAFGSDSDSDDDDDSTQKNNEQQANPNTAFEAAVSAITTHFASLTKATGVGIGERVVAVISVLQGDEYGKEEAVELKMMMSESVSRRGMKVAEGDDVSSSCDAAILIVGDASDLKSGSSLNIRHRLIPGGFMWLIIKRQENEFDNNSRFDCFPASIWGEMHCVSTSSSYSVHKIQKRACLVNAMSCPWMDKESIIEREVALAAEKTCGNLDSVENEDAVENESYIQFEMRMASRVTIVPSVAERTREKISSADEVYTTILTDANIKNAIGKLRDHGLVIIKGLLPPEQTIPWGNVVLEDFTSAVEMLKNHQTRPVDLLNPDKGQFEPLSYKEMAMREDLRVDLRSGPSMERLRLKEKDLALEAMAGSNVIDVGNQPTIITADTMGTARSSWRYHPSIIAIMKGLFNPRDESLYKGNFGRWNFGGNGPDGSPQPFRLGQIGSVVSCPGSGDQAIHADTPHLFEHTDCHPCHYCNVFTPGYKITNDPEKKNPSVQNEFVDGLWTGNSTMGGTALVYDSHRLSVSAMLLAEGDDNGNENDDASLRRQLLQLLTLRPALDAGDVVIFDNRTLHYGIANISKGDTTGKDPNAGRRPMLYLNVTQSWFHDPKVSSFCLLTLIIGACLHTKTKCCVSYPNVRTGTIEKVYSPNLKYLHFKPPYYNLFHQLPTKCEAHSHPKQSHSQQKQTPLQPYPVSNPYLPHPSK